MIVIDLLLGTGVLVLIIVAFRMGRAYERKKQRGKQNAKT